MSDPGYRLQSGPRFVGVSIGELAQSGEGEGYLRWLLYHCADASAEDRAAVREYLSSRRQAPPPPARAVSPRREGISQQRYVKFRGAGRVSAVSPSDLHVSQSIVCETPGKCCVSRRFSGSQPVSNSLYVKP